MPSVVVPGAILLLGLVLLTSPSVAHDSVPLHARVLQKNKKCKSVGKVGHGLKCKRQDKGLNCQQQKISCKDVWNNETKKCYDLRVTCSCDGKTWSCPQVRCLPPDERCVPKPQKCDKEDVGQGKKCSESGMTCLWASNPVTCGGGYNEDTKECEQGAVVEPSCHCSEQGTWNCVLPKCPEAVPDTRCPEDCSKFIVAPGETCFGEGGSCPYRDFTCTDIFNEEMETCEDVTVHTHCDCIGGQFICVIPSCLPSDERCDGDRKILPECWNEKVATGAVCTSEGLECPDIEHAMICKGIWDEDKQSCYDQTITAPCTCDGSSWECGAHIMGCRDSDKRCICPSPETIVPGETCSQTGADCPFSQGSITCTGQWNEEEQGCFDSTIETTCHCYEGQWMCAMALCAPPDERCRPKDLCPYDDKAWPIGHGLDCSNEGVECADYANAFTCSGIFVPEKQVCYDHTVVPQCKCKESKWDCQALESCPPYDPNCVNSCLYAGQGIQCSEPGLECPSSSSTITCVDQWNEEMQACYDTTISPPCHCDGESWSCAAVRCGPPDDRCVKHQCPPTDSMGPGLLCTAQGESCPWIPMSCGGPIWNEETQSCQTNTFTPSCYCDGGSWMCAIPMCAMPVPDARCSCDGQVVEDGELCFGEGGTCLQSMMCRGILQEDGTCSDMPVTNKCQCSDGLWKCDMKAACPAPDDTCTI